MASESGVVDQLGRRFEGAELVDDIKNKNIDLAFTIYQVVLDRGERQADDVGATGSDDDGSATSANTSQGNTSIVYNEGGVKVLATTLQPETDLSVDARTEKEEAERRKADEEKAKRLAEKKKEQGERAE